MAHYGTLRDFRFSTQDVDDIRGSHVYGLGDEKLGKIDDVIFDHSTGDILYVVVDTGGWLSTKKFLVPADRLQPSAEHKDDYQVGLNKRQIESFPPYNESDVSSEDHWRDYERRYRSEWETGPVLHRVGTDRNITPTAAQTKHEPGYTAPQSASEPIDIGSTRVVPAGTDSVTISNSAVGIGDRWDTFQSRLRERRKEAVLSCKSCTVGPASERSAGSVDTERKAV